MPSLDTQVPALLLRLDANPFHHGTLGAVRSLGRAGVETHVLLEGPAGPLARSRYLAGLHHHGGGPLREDELSQRLRNLAARLARPVVVLPLDDRSALALARLSARLPSDLLLPRLDAGLLERVADKSELAVLCHVLGIDHPKTLRPRTAADAARAAVALGLPAVAKWSRPWQLPPGCGLCSTSLVHREGQARALYERGRGVGGRLLLQRRLPAGRDWFFHGYFDRAGRLLAGGSGHKERCWPPDAGLTAAGRWAPNPRLERIATRLASALGYHGILDLDFRYDPAADTYHLLDFNPRPGAQFRLFTDPDGLDVVRAAHLDLTGRPVPPQVPVPGRRLVVEQYALASRIRSPRRTGTGPGVRQRAGRETAWYARDDPLPFLALIGALQRRLLTRPFAPLKAALRPRPAPAARTAEPRRPEAGTPTTPRGPGPSATGRHRTKEENADV